MPRRVALIVSVVAAVDTMFFAAIVPLLPQYADEFGLSKSHAGILVGAYPAGSLIGSLPAGWVASRIGGRRTMLIGLVLMAVTSFVFGIGENIFLLDATRFVQGLGGACMWAGGLGWLIAATLPERRGQAIGTVVGSAVFGQLLGPVLGGAAAAVGTAPVFAAVAAGALVLAALTLRIPGQPPAGPFTLASLRRLLADGRVRAGIWLVTLAALTFGVLEVLGPLRLDALGAGGAAIGLAFLAAAATEAAASPLAGRLSDRRGRTLPLRLGLVATALFGMLLPLPAVAWLLFAAIVLAGPAFGLMYTPAMAMLSDGAEDAGLDQGAASGVISLGWALGQVLGSAGGARAAEAAGDALPYAAVAALALATLALWRPRPRTLASA